MGLRAQIEAKQRRTTKVPILVGNPSVAAAEVQTHQAAYVVHLASVAEKKQAGKKPTKADTDREKQLKADLDAAKERQAATVVEVEIQSLSEDEWEAALALLPEEDRESYELGAILGPLMAASCTDEELQDADWWTEQLGKPQWTDGDKGMIARSLLELNISVPRFGALGKG